METIGRETSEGDIRRSDFRLTAQVAAYTSITAGSMAVRDFLTPLRSK